MRRVSPLVLTASGILSDTKPSSCLLSSSRPISIFGWKPYGGKSPNPEADQPSKEAIEAERRKNNHVFRKDDGTIDEALYEEMNKREAPVEMLSEDIPVRNLPSNSENTVRSADWSEPSGAIVPSNNSPSGNSTITVNDASCEVENFDTFKKSTLAYASSVDSNVLVGVGFGAGFGDADDERLGFLRPSKKGDAPRTKEEEAKWMDEQKRLGLMDPEEGTEFMDGTVYRPSRSGLQGLGLLHSKDTLSSSVDAKQKAKYDAIDKSLREGTFDIAKVAGDKSLTSADVNAALAAISSQGYGGVEPYNAERAYALAKTDEEKKLIRDRQRKLAQLQLASVLKRMSDWRGTTFSPHEHFLLADLDYNRDSLLFGRSREEFEENVKKMKKVIIDYTKWERGEYAYKYGTWLLKFVALYLALDLLSSMRSRDLLISSYDDFTTVVTETINELEARRNEDINRAIAEMKIRPPDFAPLKTSIEAERKRIRAERAAVIREEEVNAELQRREIAIAQRRSGDNDSKEVQKLRSAAAAAASQRLNFAGDATTEASQRQHPMDTSGIAFTKNTEAMDSVKEALFKSDELVSRVKAESPMDAGLANDNSKVLASAAERPAALKALGAVVEFAYNPIAGIGKLFSATEKQHKIAPTFESSGEKKITPQGSASAVDPLAAMAAGFATGTSVLEVPHGTNTTPTAAAAPQKSKPLTKAEEDEIILSGMAYSVSPTSIEAVKQVRRLLLPKSEDFINIVRAEMAAYRKSKEATVVFPGSKGGVAPN